MGIQNFKFFLEQLAKLQNSSHIICAWNNIVPHYSINDRKIGFYVDSISVLFRHLQNLVNSKEEGTDDEITDDDYKKVAIEGVLSMNRYIPDDFLTNISKFYIASDSVAPLGKLYTQNKRKQQASKIIPATVRKKATQQFYQEILHLKRVCDYTFDVQFDIDGFGEGEWKCLRNLYYDMEATMVDQAFILGNDSDIMLGAFLINHGNQDIHCIKMNLSKNVDEAILQSSLYNWKSNQPMFKLLYFFMFCLTGNDYIPPILSGTDNQYFTWMNIIVNIENNLLYPKIQQYVKPLAEYIFNYNKTIMEEKILVKSLTFIITFNAVVLSNIPYKKDVDKKFYTEWFEFERNIDHSTELVDSKRQDLIISLENGQFPSHLSAFESFTTSSLWYLCYCTYFLKKNVVSEVDMLDTLPQFKFKYNDKRILNRFEIKGGMLRQDLYENLYERLYYCYFVIERLIKVEELVEESTKND